MMLAPTRWRGLGATDRRALLLRGGAGLGLAAVVGGAVMLLLVGLPAERAVRYVLTLAIVFPAAVMAFRCSPYLLDYYIVVVVFNRQLRRVLDWYDGAFDPFPPTSLTPQLLGCLMLLVIASRFRTLSPALRYAALLIAAGLGYGFVMGVGYRLGAIFALWEYLLPVCVLFYAVLSRPDEATAGRWMRVLAACGILAATYGLVQWSVVPEWDRQWLMWSGMYSSMGMPEPFKIGIASTLSSRGPAAWFLATAVIVMVTRRAWRWPWGWPGVVLVAGTLILTTVRSAMGFAVVSVVLVTLLQRGRASRQVLVAAAVCLVLLVLALPYLPESDRLVQRVQTVGALSEDGSFQGRVQIAQHGVSLVLSHPQGFGLGSSSSTGARLIEGAQEGVGDNGWLSLLADLGFPGAALLLIGYALVVRQVWHVRLPAGGFAPSTAVGLAMIGGTATFTIIFNALAGPHAAYMWMALAPALALAARSPALRHSAGASTFQAMEPS